MELLKSNYLSNTSMMVVDSNSALAEYIMNPDTSFQWISGGFNDDATTSSLRINFDTTVTVSRIALVGINLKNFKVFYNGLTASTFAITNGDTTISYWSANSETGIYMQVTNINCTSVSIDMLSTQVANQEKAIGYLVITQEHLDFTRIPAAKNYNPLFSPVQVIHKLSDGRTRIQSLGDRWTHDIKLDYITESLRDTFLDLYNLHQSMIFVPFGTTTSWDKVIYPCVWQGPFNFHRFSDNAVGAGFEGQIKLLETNP